MIEIDNILDVEKYIDGLDGVIFDMDDTLYSEKDYVRSGYRKIAEYFGKSGIADQMWEVFERGGKAIDEVLEANGLESQKDEALRIYRFQEPDVQLYPGVAEMIAHIRETKKVGIITDGRPEGQWAKIRALGFQVDAIIVTDELGGAQFRKPNPAAFRLMRERLSIPFERMVYIGDNTKKDFVAPESLGMRTIWFRNPDGIYTI
jgi:HAD superfamily hydrolase (TIGR01549 family)